MTVRDARPADATDVARIANHYIRNTSVTFTTCEKSRDIARDEIVTRRTEGGAFLVAETGGRVTGFATYFPFRAGPGYSWTRELTILLEPGAEGRGLGRDLITALAAKATAVGVHSLIAGISAENPRAIDFHAAMGFSEVGRIPEAGRKFNRWIDLVLMQKFLSEVSPTS
ncbi:GNAT family N-acetyltransferase [Roseovarius aestuariivivens]|uniref:GNAT family N-acetyltransferase n=1 Tax=Roseovarius aestuariivivens TaxID=1888910 RepID=UPI001081A9EA|nr:GNAT family N-acetyltransferase [Roseovarius aestuariivivens]